MLKYILLPLAQAASNVRINEVSDKGTINGDCAGVDWVEFYNSGDVEEDISSYMFCDDRGCFEHSYSFPVGTIIPPKSFLVVCSNPETGFNFGIGGTDTITLYNSAADVIDSTGAMPGDSYYDRVYTRDDQGNWGYSTKPTPGAVYDGPGTPLAVDFLSYTMLGEDFFGVTSEGRPNQEFNPALPEIRLVMSEADALYMYVNSSQEKKLPAVFSYNAEQLPLDITVRPRGFGSLAMSECLGMRALPFLLDFQGFDRSQRFMGMSKAILLNCARDETCGLKDYVVNRLLARFGQPHLRSKFVRVVLNNQKGDENLGVYLLMEAIDQEYVFARSFPNYDRTQFSQYKVKPAGLGLTCDAELSLQEETSCADDNAAVTSLAAEYAFDFKSCSDIDTSFCVNEVATSLCRKHCNTCDTTETLSVTKTKSLQIKNLYDTNPTESLQQCTGQFLALRAAPELGKVKNTRKKYPDGKCSKLLLDSDRITRDLGNKESDDDITSLLDNLDKISTYVDVDQWLKMLASFAVMISLDGPLSQSGDFMLANPMDGKGWRLVQRYHELIFDVETIGLQCAESCGVEWSVAKPTCGRLMSHPLVGPLLSDTKHYQTYLRYVRGFAELMSEKTLLDEIYAVNAMLRNEVQASVYEKTNADKAKSFPTESETATLTANNDPSTLPSFIILRAQNVLAQVTELMSKPMPTIDESITCPTSKDHTFPAVVTQPQTDVKQDVTGGAYLISIGMVLSLSMAFV